MSVAERTEHQSTNETIGGQLVAGMREVLAYERGERNGNVREGRVYRETSRHPLVRRQGRTRRTSAYRTGTTLFIRHEPRTQR